MSSAAFFRMAAWLLTPLFVLFMVSGAVFRPRWRRGFFRKFGIYGSEPGVTNPVHIHCVSVGELLASVPLIRRCATELGCDIVVTVTTATGYQVACDKLGSVVGHIEFFPADVPFAVSSFFRTFSPRLCVITETELWPAFIDGARSRGIPVLVINGRISDRSFPRYVRLKRFFAPVLDHPRYLMQSQVDAERIIRMGAPPEHVSIIGNIKYDLMLKSGEISRLAVTDSTGPVLVAGSTHAGEERPVISAFTDLRSSLPGLVLVLAPRHPERIPDVQMLCEAAGLSVSRRSRGERGGDVFLLDTMGELASFYEVADLVFMGGSLVNIGGHNIMEPAFFAKPVVFGPYMHNFRDAAGEFLREGAGVQVQESGLADALRRLLADRELLRTMGAAGKRIVDRNRGSVAAVMDAIRASVPRA